MNNGHSTGYFPLERGTRQGNPLFAYLFILCVESLFIQIREDKNIKGIVISDHEIKLSPYVKSLQTILQTCITFQLYSSLKLNLDKSEACWIDTKREAKEAPINCQWVNINCCVIRTLGIFNSYDTDLMEKLNFLDKLKGLKDVLNLWECRGLSLAGRILIFKYHEMPTQANA